MLTLGIDTATRTGGVALADGGRVLRSRSFPLRVTHSESLLPAIVALLEETGRTLTDVRVVAVAAGPGSFTGLRVGLATAKGLGVGAGLRVVGVPTMEALALPFRADDLPVWILLPSKRDHLFTGLFRWSRRGEEWEPERVRPERNQRVEEFLSELEEPAFVAGPGLPAVAADLEAVAGDKIRIDERSRRDSDGSGVALLGERRALAGRFDDPRTLRPLYVVQEVARPLPEFATGDGD